MLHELMYHEKSCFITLTYSNEHIPVSHCHYDKNIDLYFHPRQTLRKKDFQLFMKRLRKSLPGKKIKYFACGEYGPETDRPHYHAIIFGLGLKDQDKQYIMNAWPFCDWNNQTIKRYSFGSAEEDSINYVAQYIDKKFSGPLEIEEFYLKNREPVFRLLSLGLGKEFVQDNAEILKENKKITIGGEPRSIPRYYLKQLNLTLEEMEELKQNALDKQKENSQKIVGLYHTDDDLYKYTTVSKYMQYHKKQEKNREQHNKNLEARANLKAKKNKPVI